MNHKPRPRLDGLKFIRELMSHWGFSRQGVMKNKNGEWLLFSQIIIILAHFVPPWPDSFPNYIWIKYISFLGLIIFGRGLLLAIKALRDLGTSLSPLPDPIPYAKLIMSGSYAYARHPLYKAIILLSLGLATYMFSLVHLLLLICLIIVLKVKANREESKLCEIHPDYNDYMKKVPAFFQSLWFLD